MEAGERWTIGEDDDIFVIGTGDCVARVCGAPEGIKNSQGWAYLIAAAPDLLAAVEAAVKHISLIGTEVGNMLEAAIAKAKGAGL